MSRDHVLEEKVHFAVQKMSYPVAGTNLVDHVTCVIFEIFHRSNCSILEVVLGHV